VSIRYRADRLLDIPGGTHWVAGEPGEQAVIFTLNTPQTIRHVSLEVPRTQDLHLSVSGNGRRTCRVLLQLEFSFSIAGTTFEREYRTISAQ
jgi:hypothetical protein